MTKRPACPPTLDHAAWSVAPRWDAWAVYDASGGSAVAYREIGPVELKGVARAIRLHSATRPG